MEWWQIYLLTRLDYLSNTMGFVMFITSICLIAPVITFLVHFEGPVTFSHWSPEEKQEKINTHNALMKLCKRAIVVLSVLFFTSGFLKIIIPSKEDVAIIIAGHWATHNAEMQKLPDNVLKTLNRLLEKAQEKIK